MRQASQCSASGLFSNVHIGQAHSGLEGTDLSFCRLRGRENSGVGFESFGVEGPETVSCVSSGSSSVRSMMTLFLAALSASR